LEGTSFNVREHVDGGTSRFIKKQELFIKLSFIGVYRSGFTNNSGAYSRRNNLVTVANAAFLKEPAH
jgi:hypothetical protein